MAMDPSMMSGDPSQDSSQDDDGSQGTTVCITASPDGTFSVQIQEAGDADESGEDESGDGPQTTDNLDDALALAKQMLTAEMGEDSADSGESSDGDAPMDPQSAKAAWNQMAAKRDKSRMMG